MNIENRATKVYLKSLPPLTALKFIDEYKIPTPHREILITVCVNRKEGFPAMKQLAKEFNINIEYWTLGRRLKEALEMFRKSHSQYYRQ
jgi:hypothetical protein